MNPTNLGSKSGTTIRNWFRPPPSPDEPTTPHEKDTSMNIDNSTHDDDDSNGSNDNDNDSDDSDSDIHRASQRPMSKLKASKVTARRETSRFTFLKTLDAIKARNDIAAVQRKTSTTGPTASNEDAGETPPTEEHDTPPHMADMRQGTLIFSMTSVAGAKRKGKPKEAGTSAPSASTSRRNSGKPIRGSVTPSHLHKRARVLPTNPEPVSPTEKAAQYLKDTGMIETSKIDLHLITNVLFKVAARAQDTSTSEMIHALASLQEQLLRQQEVTQATNTLREAAKEISNNLTVKLAELTKETVTAVRQGVTKAKASRELDKCTDVVKVAAGDLKATSGSSPKSYARAATPQDQNLGPLSALLQPATQARMERDRCRILVDLPTGQACLYPTTINNGSVAKKATEALHSIGGDVAWVFVSCTKLEKGGVLLETNRAEVKDWLLSGKRLDTFIAKFSPGATVKPKKYTIKVLYLPVDQPIDTAEAWRSIETENDLPPNAISQIKWMKPAARRGKDQQYGHATITLAKPMDANKLLQQGLLSLNTNYRCHKSKVEPLRCLKCQHYGHIASACKTSRAICATCAQHHGNEQECPQLNRKEAHACVSCNLSGHASWERSCPSRQKLQRLLDERLESNTLPYFPTDEPWTQQHSPFYSGRRSKQDLSNCDWHQAKKDRLQQTTIPDVFRPLIKNSLLRNPSGRDTLTSNTMDWSAISWDLPADSVMDTPREKSPATVAS